jgi:2-polyprenyl-3-methyl-5-hydroxy-6-metoxy-1,4-benzoquinol methylase
MLDIGGGSGVYAMEFVKKHQANTATVFDLPDIIPITKNYVEKENLTKYFGFLDGDYNSDSLGKGYDFTFLSAIVHINSPDENRLLIKKCFNALNPGGLIAIQDQLMSEDRTEPYAGALFAINMLVGTEHGDTYTEDEIRNWMLDAGFLEIIRIETFNNAMLVGRKVN